MVLGRGERGLHLNEVDLPGAFGFDSGCRPDPEVAARVLLPHCPGGGDRPDGAGEAISALVCGGDRLMIDAVLADRLLHPLAPLRHHRLLDVPEPRLAVLQDAAVAARRVHIHLAP